MSANEQTHSRPKIIARSRGEMAAPEHRTRSTLVSQFSCGVIQYCGYVFAEGRQRARPRAFDDCQAALFLDPHKVSVRNEVDAVQRIDRDQLGYRIFLGLRPPQDALAMCWRDIEEAHEIQDVVRMPSAAPANFLDLASVELIGNGALRIACGDELGQGWPQAFPAGPKLRRHRLPPRKHGEVGHDTSDLLLDSTSANTAAFAPGTLVNWVKSGLT
jgi:hypothetical protein